MSTEREMALDEWVGTLGQSHRAAKELAALRAQLAAAEARGQQVAVPDKLAIAYGLLWHVNNMHRGYDAPSNHDRPQLTPQKAAYLARGVLRELLTNEKRGDGINRAGELLGKLQMTEDAILAAIRSGINTRHRLCAAFPKQNPDDIACTVASLIFRSHVRKRGYRLEVV